MQKLAHEGKNEIITFYSYLIIMRIINEQYKKASKFLKGENSISFKIQFILKHQEFYSSISDDFIVIFNGLQFIREFYKTKFAPKNDDNKRIKLDE